MENEFAPYTESLALKELGFDEECFAYYLAGAIRFKEYKDSKNKNSAFYNNTVCSMPTFSQAFRWFREKYDLYSCIERVEYINSDEKGFQWSIFEKCSNVGEELKTYEEAELECLKKLIEIVKEK